MDALLDEYKMRFGEQFPMMLCRHMTEEEIRETIQQCLDDNKPYTSDIDSDSDY